MKRGRGSFFNVYSLHPSLPPVRPPRPSISESGARTRPFRTEKISRAVGKVSCSPSPPSFCLRAVSPIDAFLVFSALSSSFLTHEAEREREKEGKRERGKRPPPPAPPSDGVRRRRRGKKKEEEGVKQQILEGKKERGEGMGEGRKERRRLGKLRQGGKEGERITERKEGSID